MQIPYQNGQERILRNDLVNTDRAQNTSATPAPHRQQVVGHSSDALVANLRAQFEGQQLRPEVVAAAQQLLASGELLSPAAAEETAQAVIGIVKYF